MTPATKTATQPDANELVIVRHYDAPPALVFDAWTSPAHLGRWIGPAGFATPSVEVDFRLGGGYALVISSPKDGTFGARGVYREIERPNRLVFTFKWDSTPPDEPETLVTLTFTDQGSGRTEMEFRQSPFSSVGDRDGHAEGWNEAFDKLGDYLTKS